MDSRVIELTPSAEKYGNLNIRVCGRAFFPDDVVGGPTKADMGEPITLFAARLPQPVHTDIPSDRHTGKPRWIFRQRAWLKAFLRSNNLRPGDSVAIRRVSARTYQVAPIDKTRRPQIPSLLDFFHITCEPAWPDDFGRRLSAWLASENVSRIRTLSLFTGAGGLDIGFHDAGFDVLQTVEIDERFVATLNANSSVGGSFESCKVLHADVRDFDAAHLHDVHFIIGGPPCQTFSAAARRAGGVPGTADARGKLFEAYVRLLKSLRPIGFLFENVYGITGANKGKDWDLICRSFEGAGYNVFWRVLDSADYGVPQHRERMFIVGTREASYRFPYPTHGPDSPLQSPFYTAGVAVEGICKAPRPEGSQINGRYGHLLAKIPPGLNYSFFTEKMGHPNPIFAWRSKFSDFLYKADPDKPTRTIKAQGGQYTGPFHWHNRPFTVAELKRLQTFPDRYRLVGGRSSSINQIGNSVPPQLARILAISVLSQIFAVSLPFEFPLLHPSHTLTFRKRKRLLTTEYVAKARRALKASGGELAHKNPTRRNYAAQLTSDFRLLRTRSPNDSFRVSFHPTRTRWSISVNRARSRRGQFTIKVGPRTLLGWPLPTRAVLLTANALDREAFTSVWKAFETELAHLHIKADLVQLCGYYQYEPSIITQMEILRHVSPFWTAVTRIVAQVGTRRPIRVENAASLWGLPEKQIWPFAEFLRTLGYEVRNTNTNPKIPNETLLVPYPFPTLSYQSVQLRKDLGK